MWNYKSCIAKCYADVHVMYLTGNGNISFPQVGLESIAVAVYSQKLCYIHIFLDIKAEIEPTTHSQSHNLLQPWNIINKLEKCIFVSISPTLIQRF